MLQKRPTILIKEGIRRAKYLQAKKMGIGRQTEKQAYEEHAKTDPAEILREEERLLALEMARERVRQDLQHRYQHGKSQRNRARYQSLTSDTKYRDIAKARSTARTNKK